MSTASNVRLQQTFNRVISAIKIDQPLNKTNKLANPCSLCNRNVTDSGIVCDTCNKWCHPKCEGMSQKEFQFYVDTSDDPDVKWHCLYCTVKFHRKNIPFTLSDTHEINKINQSDSMAFCQFLPSEEIISETSKFETLDHDPDTDIPTLLNSKYHSVEELQKLKDQKNFKIFHSNVNGLESKFQHLNNFLDGTKSPFDVIAISETSENKNDSFIANVSLDNYISPPFSTPTNSSKGGVCLYVNKDFDTIERIDLKVQNDLFEAVWIEIKNKDSKNIVCGCVYRHPRVEVDSFFNYMDSTLKKISDEEKEVYICGDFNINLLRLDRDKTPLIFSNLMNSYNCLPLIVHPSRVVEGQIPSLIDNIFTNNLGEEILTGNIYLNLSEHFSQFASIPRGKIDVKKIIMYGRNSKNYVEANFIEDVSNQQWNYTSQDSSFLMADMVGKLGDCVDRHKPLKRLSPKEIKTKMKPWITPEILKLIRIRDKLFARKKRQPSNEHVREVYIQARNRVNHKIKSSKKEYHKAYFERYCKDVRKIWEGIRKLVYVKKNTSFSISHLNVKNRIIDDPQDIAENLNDFFVTVGPETEKSVPVTPNMSHKKFMKNQNIFSMIIAHISNDEVLELIKSLPVKGSGPASIPLDLLKVVADIIVFPLCFIINTSFSTGVFPECLKVAKVLALHKGGSTEELNNFRPISLLSIFDKIIEKLMHKRLYAFFEEHDILCKNQFGFRKGYSTIYALIEIIEKIKSSLDEGKFGCGIFIDLKKAFDTVNHEILLSKLEHYGIRGPILNWFRSYLTDRKQFVFCNGVQSSTKTITCGVPQGSVLGPLLFLIYINDLPNISDKLQFFLFADDTNIYYEDSDLRNLEKTMNKELKKLSLWLNLNRLALNISKTNFVIFRTQQKKIDHNVTLILNRKAIEQKRFVKYLGLLVDEHLTWEEHINGISKRISRSIGIITLLRSSMDIDLLVNLYYSLVYSHLIYGIHVWGSACQTELEKIQVLQNKAVRVISKVQHFQIYGEPPGPLPSADPLFKNLEILKLNDIFKFHIVKFVFQCLNRESPPTFQGWFNVNSEIHQHGTTSSVEILRENYFDVGTVTESRILHTRQSNLINYGGKSLQVTGPILWNDLPTEIRNKERLNPFKYYSKKHYNDPLGTIVVIRNNNNNPNHRNPRQGHRSRLANNAGLNRPFASRWNEQ